MVKITIQADLKCITLPVIWGWSNSRTSLRLYRRVCRIFSLRQILLYFIDPQHARVYSEKNLSLGYILKILLKCRKFQPQCFWKGDCSENCTQKCHPSSCHFFCGFMREDRWHFWRVTCFFAYATPVVLSPQISFFHFISTSFLYLPFASSTFVDKTDVVVPKCWTNFVCCFYTS